MTHDKFMKEKNQIPFEIAGVDYKNNKRYSKPELCTFPFPKWFLPLRCENLASISLFISTFFIQQPCRTWIYHQTSSYFTSGITPKDTISNYRGSCSSVFIAALLTVAPRHQVNQTFRAWGPGTRVFTSPLSDSKDSKSSEPCFLQRRKVPSWNFHVIKRSCPGFPGTWIFLFRAHGRSALGFTEVAQIVSYTTYKGYIQPITNISGRKWAHSNMGQKNKGLEEILVTSKKENKAYQATNSIISKKKKKKNRTAEPGP